MGRGATFSQHKTYITGETITASDRNADSSTILNNLDPSGIGSYYQNATEMQAASDPYPGDTASVPADNLTHLKQIQFQLDQVIGKTYWYEDPDTSILLEFNKGSDIASATALALGVDGNYFDVTGTTTITSINTRRVGSIIKLHFDGALILTHNATDLILPLGANLTTVAGDELEFFEYDTGKWRCIGYLPISNFITPTHDHEGGEGATLGPNGMSAILGSWTSKTYDTNYQAASDGFVVAYNSGQSQGYVEGYTDSGATPTTLVAADQAGNASPYYASITFPVKKDDYYKVTRGGVGSVIVRFIPLGN